MNIRRFAVVAFSALALLLATSPTAQADSFAEGTDVGGLPANATDLTAQLAVNTISGTVSSGDEDMYKLCLDPSGGFTASTVGGATFDTQLFLFNAAGAGVAVNDDTAGGGLRSRLDGPLMPAGGGTFYLAISGFNNDARDGGGNLIFPNEPFIGVHAPFDGDAIASWSAATSGNGTYTITLTGLCAEPAECKANAPVPAGYTLKLGTAGNDTINGTSGRDLIRGLAGNDTINGYSSDDILCGNAGNDTLDGGSGNDVVSGGSGTDSLNGNSGTDTGLDNSAADTYISIEL